MLKHIAALLVISFLLIIFSEKVQWFMSFLDTAHSWLNNKLSYIFNTSPIGNTTQEALCLLLIPVIFASLPAGAFWVVKRKLMPYFYHLVWALWLILFISLTLTR